MDHKRSGERVGEERLRLDLTQAQLAEAIGISDTYMGAIEHGERSLMLDTLVRLVNRLGVTVDRMLSGSVSGSDANIMERSKQIIDRQPLERKQRRGRRDLRPLDLWCFSKRRPLVLPGVDKKALAYKTQFEVTDK